MLQVPKGQGQGSLWSGDVQSIIFSDVNLLKSVALLGTCPREGSSAPCHLAVGQPAKMGGTCGEQKEAEEEGE